MAARKAQGQSPNGELRPLHEAKHLVVRHITRMLDGVAVRRERSVDDVDTDGWTTGDLPPPVIL